MSFEERLRSNNLLRENNSLGITAIRFSLSSKCVRFFNCEIPLGIVVIPHFDIESLFKEVSDKTAGSIFLRDIRPYKGLLILINRQYFEPWKFCCPKCTRFQVMEVFLTAQAKRLFY